MNLSLMLDTASPYQASSIVYRRAGFNPPYDVEIKTGNPQWYGLAISSQPHTSQSTASRVA
jgi:hypothetical protein